MAENLLVPAENADITSQDAFISAEQAAVSTAQATVVAEEANISADVLQQTNINETTIADCHVSAGKADIMSGEAIISAEHASVSAAHATVVAEESNISADVLQQTIIHETTIANCHVDDLQVELAEKLSVSAEKADITSGEAFISAELASVSGAHATLVAEEANISAEVLQQTNIHETNIADCHVDDFQVELAENLSVSAEKVKISSAEALISAEHASVSTAQATVVAEDANISADVLQQTNIFETSIADCHVDDLQVELAKNLSVSAEKADITSGEAFISAEHASVSGAHASVVAEEANISAEVLQQTNIYETSIADCHVDDLQVELAENISVFAEKADIKSGDAYVSAEHASVSGVHATVVAEEANISADVLQQTNIQETNISDAQVNEMHVGQLGQLVQNITTNIYGVMQVPSASPAPPDRPSWSSPPAPSAWRAPPAQRTWHAPSIWSDSQEQSQINAPFNLVYEDEMADHPPAWHDPRILQVPRFWNRPATPPAFMFLPARPASPAALGYGPSQSNAPPTPVYEGTATSSGVYSLS